MIRTFFCGDDLRWVPAPFPQKESNGSYHYWWRIKRNKQTSKLLEEFISTVFRLQNLSTACKLRCEAETREGKISKAEQEWEEACFFWKHILIFSPWNSQTAFDDLFASHCKRVSVIYKWWGWREHAPVAKHVGQNCTAKSRHTVLKSMLSQLIINNDMEQYG